MIRLQSGWEELMSRLETSILLGAVVMLAAVVPASAADRYKGFERAEALITVQELKQLSEAKDPKLVLLGVVEPISSGPVIFLGLLISGGRTMSSR